MRLGIKATTDLGISISDLSIKSLRCFQDNLSGSEVKSLLHLYIAERNSLFEKGSHSVRVLSGISSNSDISTC